MDFSDPHLARPWVLWLVAPAALAIFGLLRFGAHRRAGALGRFVSERMLARSGRNDSPGRRLAKELLLCASALLLGVALAGPRWGVEVTTSTAQSEDVVFVLDTSRSMLVKDMRPSRLERAKSSIAAFVRRKGTGSVGLVAFSGQAFLQCPLTRDYDAFFRTLNETDTRAIPVPGTDLARALEEAEGAFVANRNRKLVILLTDGEDLEAGGVDAAGKLARKGLVVHTVGVGTQSGGQITVVGPTGTPDALRDEEGNAVTSRLDESTLTKVAAATGGRYVRLGQAGEGMEALRLAIQAGTDAANDDRRGIPREDLFAAAALLLLVIESLLSTRRNR
jgi:Ca-activated chloride channel family protein